MTKKTCVREPEVVAAVLAECLSDELRTHVTNCSVCGEVARVATLVHDDYVHVRHEASMPTADVVWLRAQIRAREESARIAARPIMLTQALAIAALIGLLVSLAGRLSLGVWTWPVLDDGSLLLLLRLSIVLACGLIFAPVVLYFAFSRD
jgi:hypothetical protein